MPGEINWSYGIAFGKQSGGLGIINGTIRELQGALVIASGLVLGDADSGEGGSGISYREARRHKEKAVVTGSFTKQASEFEAVTIEALSFAWPFSGSRNTVTAPIDGSDFLFDADVGIDAILQAAGLVGADWGGGDGRIYTPANAAPMTVKLWTGNDGTNAVARVLMDCFVNLEIAYTPGEVPIATATIVGIEPPAAQAGGFPKLEAVSTFDYEEQGAVGGAIVEAVGHNWGISATVRGFEELTLSIDNELEELDDSEATGGKRQRQTGRAITLTGTIIADLDESDFELGELRRTSVPVDQLDFQVGDDGTDTNPALAHQVVVPTPELRDASPRQYGPSLAHELELAAVSGSADAEISIIFR